MYSLKSGTNRSSDVTQIFIAVLFGGIYRIIGRVDGFGWLGSELDAWHMWIYSLWMVNVFPLLERNACSEFEYDFAVILSLCVYMCVCVVAWFDVNSSAKCIAMPKPYLLTLLWCCFLVPEIIASASCSNIMKMSVYSRMQCVWWDIALGVLGLDYRGEWLRCAWKCDTRIEVLRKVHTTMGWFNAAWVEECRQLIISCIIMPHYCYGILVVYELLFRYELVIGMNYILRLFTLFF